MYSIRGFLATESGNFLQIISRPIARTFDINALGASTKFTNISFAVVNNLLFCAANQFYQVFSLYAEVTLKAARI